MPADDYTAAISGGLKLKGVNSSAKISKSHRKKRPKPAQPEASSADADNAEESKDGALRDDGDDVKDERDDAVVEQSRRSLGDGKATPLSPLQAGKTEAELRHEERRRKRVCDFLCLSQLTLLSRWGLWLTFIL